MSPRLLQLNFNFSVTGAEYEAAVTGWERAQEENETAREKNTQGKEALLAIYKDHVALETVHRKLKEKIKAMARIFAAEAAQVVAQNALKIVNGTGAFDKDKAAAFLRSIAYDQLICGCENLVRDMDKVADILFRR